MRFVSFVTLFLLATATFLNITRAAKILSVFPYPGPSQYIFASALLKGLAQKGHNVTSISVFPQKQPVKNFRDVVVLENLNVYADFLMEYSNRNDDKLLLSQFLEISEMGEKAVRNVFENSEVQSLMKQEKFDLVIVEILLTEALLGFGEIFEAPVIAISTFGTISFMDYLVGNPSPLSYIPNMGLPFDNHMTLMQRLGNVLMSGLEYLGFNYLILPRQEKLYNKYFPTATKTFDEARKTVSLVLLNNHFSLSFPRPYVPNMIEVGGLHINEQPDPLPQDLQQFLDEATEGAIYFSMGSNIKSKDLPAEKLKLILETFRELKIKVLWKFEEENLPSKPDNVVIKKWYPQPSVLAHPNVKLFISHGGFLSTTETIFYGKPILGIPMLGDQNMNVKNAVKAGFALSLHLATMTKETFMATIKELWENPKYTQAVQRLSKQFQDKPMTPMETAIYWVEYVLRHDGAAHMQNAGQSLNFWQYHNIDVFVIILVGFIVLGLLISGVVVVIQKMCRKYRKVFKTSRKTKAKRK